MSRSSAAATSGCILLTGAAFAGLVLFVALGDDYTQLLLWLRQSIIDALN